MRALLHCRHHHHHHHPLRSPIPLANMSSLSLPLPSSAASSPRCLLLLAAAAAAPDPSFKPSLFLRLSGAPRNGSPGLRLGKVGRRSRAFMGVSAGTQKAVDDGLFLDYKSSTAFLFPGQGAQAVGMGKDSQSVPAAAELYKKANDILGYDLLDVCSNGPKEKIDSTVISQPAIYVTSLAAVEILRAREGGQQIIESVDVTCGLSLGEYTALAFAGAFSFEDGLKLVKLRGEAMQEAADAARSAMVSVIGLDSEKVQLLCDAANEEVDDENKVQIANYLCTGNYSVSGGLKGIEAVEAKAKSFKARMTVRLAVAGAFHTSFMKPAVSRLEAALAATEIKTPRIPVISNVDAKPHADPDTIKRILANQVTSPVQWETTIKTLLTKGLKKSYELGPGKVIAGIVKRMDKTAEVENIGA
ncbi:uncharacterized protein LOC115670224 isoform X1 [Syzygium oleosum]|uniref:uncharacterized protein LOC115670224 isoform X1 n=1 Tax=Syzygium oleosum TaxID=219896 RepID=UPI0024B8917A|nr:uncharacterized protein LOC115670224 isoform X1 [Syzygium oleosum]